MSPAASSTLFLESRTFFNKLSKFGTNKSYLLLLLHNLKTETQISQNCTDISDFYKSAHTRYNTVSIIVNGSAGRFQSPFRRPLSYLQVWGQNAERHLQILTLKICAVGNRRCTLYHWHLSHAIVTSECVKRHAHCTHIHTHSKQR